MKEQPSLGTRESDVLAELARHEASSVAFQGLRRLLGLHQQALTRTLRRLEQGGLVTREPSGYRATEQGLRQAARPPPEAAAEPLTVIHALLPTHIGPDETAHLLSGRWFSGLHWYGSQSGAGGLVLTWTSDADGALVRLHVIGHAMRLEVEPQEGGAVFFAPLRALLAALGELYGASPPQGPAFACDEGTRMAA